MMRGREGYIREFVSVSVSVVNISLEEDSAYLARSEAGFRRVIPEDLLERYAGAEAAI